MFTSRLLQSGEEQIASLREQLARLRTTIEATEGALDLRQLPRAVSTYAPLSDFSDFVVLFARQRSGTNGLRSVLGRHEDVNCLPELFNVVAQSSPHVLVRDANFWHYQARESALSSRNGSRGDVAVTSFLEHLRGQSEKRFTLVDVKYNATRDWVQTFGYPFPLHIFTRLGMAVVHLKRAHYLRYLVSLQKAERLRRYSVRLNDKRAPYQDLPVALDTRILISTFEACEHEDAVFSNHFHGHPRYLAWEYSELFDEDGRVGPAFLERFCALLGIDNTWATAAGVADAIPNTVKLPSEPLEVAISNFDDVRQTLKGTRWESLLEDERAPRPTPPAQRAKSAQRTPRRNAPGDYSDFVVLLARQRSGSNALLTALEAHDEIATFLTVIAPRHASDPNSFFRFVAERSSGAPAAADHAALFPQFLEQLREVSPKRISVLEVKPNTVSQIVSPYHTFVEPLLFELIDAHGIRVLHLTRENYLRSMLSAQKARRLGSWHVTATAGPAQDVAAELNTRDMLRRFAEWSREDEAIRQRFADSDNYLGCEYTQLFDLDTGELTTRFRSDLGAMLGIDTDWPALPAYRKGSHLPLEQAIENYEEVAAALRGTEFEAFLDDEPSYRTHVAQSAEEPTA